MMALLCHPSNNLIDRNAEKKSHHLRIYEVPSASAASDIIKPLLAPSRNSECLGDDNSTPKNITPSFTEDNAGKYFNEK